MRRHYREAIGLDDFLALGLIAISYGTALVIGGYGFLAVFAAGVSLRRVEMIQSDDEVTRDSVAALSPEAATDPANAPAFMAQAVLAFAQHVAMASAFGLTPLAQGKIRPPALRSQPNRFANYHAPRR